MTRKPPMLFIGGPCVNGHSPGMARALLLFPVSVVALAFVSFALGGHCAAWQWWLAPALFVYVDLAAGPAPWRRRALCPLVLAFVCFLIRPHTLSDRVIYAETLVERREILCDMFKGPGVPLALRRIAAPCG